MNPTVSLLAHPSSEDMPHGHVSSLAFYRIATEAVVQLARAVFPSEWNGKVLFINDISLRFVRAVECAGEALSITAGCPKPPALEHGIAGFSGEIRFGNGLLAVRFQGRMVLR